MAPSSEDHPWVRPIDIDKLVAENKAKFDSTGRFTPCVVRLPAYVRELKPHMYDPSFFPLGLLCSRHIEDASSVYHLKLEVISIFLEHLEVDQDGWKTFCEEIATQGSSSDTPDVEHFYEDDGTFSSLPLKSIQSILVTDAFFIIAVIIHNRGEHDGGMGDEVPRFRRRVNDILQREGVRNNLFECDRDIFWLYEGQIPLFLVKNAWERVASVSGTNMSSFSVQLKKSLHSTLRYSSLPGINQLSEGADIKLDTCDHLLVCLHRMLAWVPPHPEGTNDEDEENVDGEKASTESEEEGRCCKSYICKLPVGRQILDFVEKLATALSKVLVRPPNNVRVNLPLASQLAKTGISFQGADIALGDVRFVKSFFRLSAVLYLPVWKNCIASQKRFC